MTPANSKDVVPGVFSRHAAAYRDRLADAIQRGEARGRLRILELLAVRQGARVLDLGCGPGTLTHLIRDAVGAGGLVVGVDLAPGMLALAHADAGPTVVLARMDMEQLAFRDGAFHAVASGHSLHFCPDLRRVLEEARRVLGPDGRFAASVPLPSRRRDLLEDALDGLLPPATWPADVQETRELLSADDRVRSALLRAGFRAAIAERVDEVSHYRDPAELVAKSMSWWAFAGRMELLPEEEQRRVQSEALRRLRQRVGDGPLEIPGASMVMMASRHG